MDTTFFLPLSFLFPSQVDEIFLQAKEAIDFIVCVSIFFLSLCIVQRIPISFKNVHNDGTYPETTACIGDDNNIMRAPSVAESESLCTPFKNIHDDGRCSKTATSRTVNDSRNNIMRVPSLAESESSCVSFKNIHVDGPCYKTTTTRTVNDNRNDIMRVPSLAESESSCVSFKNIHVDGPRSKTTTARTVNGNNNDIMRVPSLAESSCSMDSNDTIFEWIGEYSAQMEEYFNVENFLLQTSDQDIPCSSSFAEIIDDCDDWLDAHSSTFIRP